MPAPDNSVRALLRCATLAAILAPLSAVAGDPGTDDAPRLLEHETGNLTLSLLEQHNRHQVAPGKPVIGVSTLLPLGDARMRIGTTDGENQRRYQLGLVGQRAELSLFSGDGEDISTLEQPVGNLDPHFFHGGSYQPYRYSGMAAAVSLGDRTETRFAMARIRTDGSADRDSYYLGFGSSRHGGGLFAVENDGRTAATGFDLEFDTDAASFRLQQIDHVNNARYRTLSLHRGTTGGSWFSVALESGRNPLYASASEDRVMFRFGGTLGRQPVALGATDGVDAPTEAPAKKSRAGGIAILAGTVVALGVASSSGDEEKDSRPRFNTQHLAARDVLNRINPTSVRQNREHGGWIYRNRDGTYGNTVPVAGQVASVDIGIPSEEVPGGTTASASYHTHGGPDPRYDNENFSPADILSDNLQRVDGYLGTPAGFMKFHDFQTQSITTIGRIAN